MSEIIKMGGHLIYPRKCIGCREIFNIFSEDYDPNVPYCKTCRAEWEKAKILPCNECRVAAIECSCVPEVLEKVAVASLFKFGTVPEADRMVYTIKRKRLPRVYGFAADELAHRMISFSRERGIDLSNAVITYVPRSKRSIVRYGFDHGKLLSIAVAERLGLPFLTTTRRKGRGKDQKKLSKSQRLINSAGRFRLIMSSDVKGKTVIIIDDVITTGSTVASCAGAIYEGEPERIVILCLAKGNKTVKKQ